MFSFRLQNRSLDQRKSLIDLLSRGTTCFPFANRLLGDLCDFFVILIIFTMFHKRNLNSQKNKKQSFFLSDSLEVLRLAWPQSMLLVVMPQGNDRFSSGSRALGLGFRIFYKFYWVSKEWVRLFLVGMRRNDFNESCQNSARVLNVCRRMFVDDKLIDY